MKRGLFLVALVVVVGLVGWSAWTWYEARQTEYPNQANGAAKTTIATTTDAYDIKITLPPSDTDAGKSVGAYMQNQQSAFMADANTAYAQYLAQKPDWPWRQYQQVIEYESHTVGGYDSYIVREYDYTGGANGNDVVSSFTYDAQGKAVTLADLVPAEKRDALMGSLRDQLYQLNGYDAGSQGVFQDAINKLTFESLTSFYLSGTDLVIAFNKYDVAPGAVGAPEIHVPLADYTNIQ